MIKLIQEEEIPGVFTTNIAGNILTIEFYIFGEKKDPGSMVLFEKPCTSFSQFATNVL